MTAEPRGVAGPQLLIEERFVMDHRELDDLYVRLARLEAWVASVGGPPQAESPLAGKESSSSP